MKPCLENTFLEHVSSPTGAALTLAAFAAPRVSKKQLFGRGGFSLIEMLVYVSLLALIFLFIVNMILSYTTSYHELLALRATENSGVNSMERMTRDIRAAKTATVSGATLTLITPTINSVSTTSYYYLYNGALNVDINNASTGPLTVSGATVINLTFTGLTSSNSSAVKIDMTIQGVSENFTATKKYHSTIILKG